MLLEFKMKNFKSFRDETIFSMQPTGIKTHKEYVISKLVENKDIKALPVAVIYGANASGKSNIIKAMRFFKRVIQSGDLKSKDVNYTLRHTPFIHDESYYQPSELSAEFICNNRKVKFSIEYNVRGLVMKESLDINDKVIYIRDGEKIQFESNNAYKENLIDDNNDKYLNTFILKALENQDGSQLFFNNGFKVLINKSFYNDINEWIEKWNIITDINNIKIDKEKCADFINLSKDDNNERILQSSAINLIMEKAEFGSQKIRFSEQADTEEVEIKSLYEIKMPTDNSREKIVNILFESDMMESKGTIQLIRLVTPFVDVLKSGGIIVLDEMDSSMHFEIGVSLIRVFNNKEINVKGAQLIFNSHNPIYLDGTILRHDQLVMVSKNPNELTSEIYYLSDFGLRPEERILKNYLNGKYGALPKMDLEAAFRKILIGEEASE